MTTNNLRRAGRRKLQTPAGRAHAARRAFLDVLRDIRGRVTQGGSFEPTDFRDVLLSVISTSERIRSYGIVPARPHKNLFERNPAVFQELETLVCEGLRANERPEDIFGRVRSRASVHNVAI